MKKYTTHINQEELKKLLLSNEIDNNSLSENELRNLEKAVSAYEDYTLVEKLNVDEAWTKFNTKTEPIINTVKNRKSFFLIGVYITSAIAAIGLIMLFLYPLAKIEKLINNTDNQLTYSTITGGVVTLPDGSVVSLNEKSNLRYPKQFTGNERNVELDGEAFFEVKRDTLHPFIIKAAEAHVKVLGTSFSVNTMKNNRVEVIVATGKVEVWHSKFDKHVFLTSGRKTIAFNEVAPIIMDADMNEIAWKTGVLKFTNCSLEYIASSLSKTYHKPIVLNNNRLNKLRLTATFENQSLDDILSVVAQTHHLNVKSEGDGFILETNMN